MSTALSTSPDTLAGRFDDAVWRHVRLQTRSPLDSAPEDVFAHLMDPEWSQFFDSRGVVLNHLFPTMMVGMMNRGLRGLQKTLGGKGGAMEMVR